MTIPIERRNQGLSALLAETISSQRKNDKTPGAGARTQTNSPARATGELKAGNSTRTSASPPDLTVSSTDQPSNPALDTQVAPSDKGVYLPTPKVTLDPTNVSTAVDVLPKNEMDFAAVLKTLKDLSQAQKAWDRTQRNAGFTIQICGLHASADQIRESAKLSFGANMAQSVSQIGAGAGQMGMSGAGLRMTKTQITTSRQAETLGAGVAKGTPDYASASSKTLAKLQDDAAQAGAQAAHLNNVAMGVGSAGQGLGGLASAPLQYSSTMADAARTDDETDAKRGEALQSQSNDSMQSHADTIRSVNDDLKALLMTPLEASRRVNANIA